MNSWTKLVTPLLLAGIGAFTVAWFLLLGRRWRAGRVLMAAGGLLVAALALTNSLIAGEPPLGNMYHVLAILAVCLPPLYIWLERRAGLGWTAAYFAFPSAFALIGAFWMREGAQWQRMPALQSPWFVPHVLSYMLSYALAAVAFALLAVKLTRNWLNHPDVTADYTTAAAEILRLAFPFMTFGLLSGAIWAEAAWGAFWSWDPKETWSLITWIGYLIFFHCRRDRRTERYADLAHALAFVALLTTFFVVNLLPKLGSGLHSYT